MLDSETKRRIDSARDILVGKVPDPKSQVEQITIALIYKFMDDMDKQSIEMGGKASFFKGEFKKYGWGNIFDPRLGGVEMLNLYGEAITRMSQNANLPELFRNIFKNAYLPYRDPETLKLFLKTINDFTYDHSEKLGDAFEYLLSVLGSQGDAGQFRTPRHIIDFMVQVVDPKKNEAVLDPACGTAGFLISAYKYIVNANSTPSAPPDGRGTSPKSDRSTVGFGGGKGGGLNAQDKQKLYENFTGYDISPDMVRLSLVNLYLHGFVKPQIHEYDSLASEERWNEYADVILANPPFMSPKGGIMPHKKFSVQSNRSEVLFVDYMAEHLTPNGRAAIIVPEGIIFQSAGAYKQLRKYLIENNFLWAVVSLPAGAFNPYSGVKTSILFLDRSLAKKTDKVLFVKVENDGFDLGAQRRPIDKNDLPETLRVLQTLRVCIQDGKTASFVPEVDSALLVSISKLEESDYNLSADRYREVIRTGKQTHPLVALGEIATFYNGRAYKQEELLDDESKTPVLRVGNLFTNNSWYYSDLELDDNKYCSTGDLLYAWSASFGPFIWDGPKSIYHYHIWKVEHSDKIEKKFLYHMLQKVTETIRGETHGIAMLHMTKADMEKVQIPLPPIEIQRQLVDEITAHQRIIDGACQVVEGWKPNLELELTEFLPKEVEKFPCAFLGETVKIVAGFSFSSKDFSKKNPIKSIKITNVGVQEFIETDDSNLPIEFQKKYSEYLAEHGDIAVSLTRSIISSGFKFALVPKSYANSLLNQRVALIKQNDKVYDVKYIYYALASDDVYQYVLNKSRSLMQPNLSINDLKAMPIPLPPLEIQREIVARIETERALVHGNRELIRLYEEKVKKVIERVWEG